MELQQRIPKDTEREHCLSVCLIDWSRNGAFGRSAKKKKCGRRRLFVEEARNCGNYLKNSIRE